MRGFSNRQPYHLALQFEYGEGPQSVDVQRVLDDAAAVLSTVKEAVASEINTLSLGQASEEVLTVMRPHNKKVDIGKKMIFMYDDLKNIRKDRVVTHVQTGHCFDKAWRDLSILVYT